MQRYGTILTTALLAIAASAPLRADDEAWKAISEEAAMVVRLQNPAKAMRDLTAFAALVADGGRDQVEQWLASMPELMSLPKLAGVDLESSWWIALYATDIESEPAHVLLLPATDKKLLRESLDVKFRTIDCGKYLAITVDNASAEKTAARLRGAGKSLRDVMDPENRALFDGGQLSVFGHMSPLTKAGLGGHAPDKRPDRQSGKPDPGRNLVTKLQGRDAIDITPEWLSRAADDLQCATMTFDISEAGITLNFLVRFRSGSAAAKLIPQGVPNQFDDVSALPPGGILYVGATGDWTERGRFLLKSKEGDENNPDRIVPPNQALSSAQADIDALPLSSFAFSTRMSRDYETLGDAIISRPKDVSRFKNLSRRIAALHDGARTEAFQWKVERKLAAERYGEDLADVTDWHREFRKRREARFRAESWTTREVFREEYVVATEGGDREDMQALLAALESVGKAPQSDSPRARTRNRLDPKSDLIVLVDAPRACIKLSEVLALALWEGLSQNLFLGWLMKDAKPPDPADAFAQLQLPESFSGLSLNAVPDGVRVCIFMPLEQVQGFAQFSQVDFNASADAEKVEVAGDRDDGWNEPDPDDAKKPDEDEDFPRLDVRYFDSIVFGGSGDDGEEKSRKLKETMQELMLESVDWACELSPLQKQKIRLAGKGDLARIFGRIRDERRRFQELADSEGNDDRNEKLSEDASSARKLLDSNPFSEDSMFIKAIRTSLTAEQLPKYEAVRAITRVAGKVSTGAQEPVKLRSIDLHSTRFADSGLALLGNLTFVQVLNLDSTRVTDAGLTHLRSLEHIEELDLSRTDVGAAGLAHLAGLARLRVLGLARTQAHDDALAHLAGLRNLTSLNLFGTAITDGGLAHLNGLKNLESLQLGGTDISDDGLIKLDIGNLARLEDVGLDGTEVSDAGVKALARLPVLRELDLRNSRVTDAGLTHLHRATSLRALYLDGADVSKSAIDSLQAALPELKIYGR